MIVRDDTGAKVTAAKFRTGPKPCGFRILTCSINPVEDCDKSERTRLYTLVFLTSALLHFQGNVSTVLSALAACVATFLSRFKSYVEEKF